MSTLYSYEDFLKIIEKLRSEEGCPWDKEQTHESLKSYLVEECYELVEAIEKKDDRLMQEELGDVLLQVIMHAQIAKERGAFDIKDVVQTVSEKMVHRHPHVFGTAQENLKITSTEEVLVNWEAIKVKEKKEKSLSESIERVAKTLPALMRTQKIQKKVMKNSKQKQDVSEEIDRLIRELETLKYEDLSQKTTGVEEKIGKIMFEVVNLSTFFDINAEFTLTKSLEKFINRFRYIENSRLDED